MTGRELIMYILANGLEDQPVVKDGQILGFISIEQAAVKFGVGYETIRAWLELRALDGFMLAGRYYIPANAKVRFHTDDNILQELYCEEAK